MNIMVFDVAAERGGAFSVLYEFYIECLNDNRNEYIFVLSTAEIIDKDNIKIIKFPWVKNSWLHRLFFDYLIAPKLVKKYRVDKVISLQNIIIPNIKVSQTVYIHNVLPFTEIRFSILRDRILWIYQNIISRSIYKSIKKADNVVVQTEWMKKICSSKTRVDKDKIEIRFPKISLKVKKKYCKTKESTSTFIYPASGEKFKNHRLIIDACMNLKRAGVNNYRIYLTLRGDENKEIIRLSKIIKKYDLPINFIGNLPKDQVFKYYSKSILLFPSYLETVGLPLIEAKLHETPIISSDCSFSREVVGEYKDCYFIDKDDHKRLAELIFKFIQIR